ncbi:aminoacyl-histidine dipeptidase [Sphingobacterium paludis]|uniref:Cytosol non-specific dipeptidase n=1 Tax=Sphingobacterium paludis TaxID=1476465 RepID=A0A4R7CZ94_9SPHI|nr:aminoacyl-histidine dipeptidase [Sphingobacterium paludis]TDS11856.1 dipeptidase D [Sphingobacterium paludis]
MLEQLEPKAVWHHFEALNAVPRASKKEERVIQFMLDFGASLGLETVKDSVGNVVIRKPATAGMEGRQTVVLQSHLDMVHQKNNDTEFDFANEGIRMLVDGEWVRAEGTTLGADNGMGVAAIMAILSAPDIAHPPLEALFTVDEETGMTGAKGLQAGLLKGSILLNLDTEEDTEIDIGCAGGVDITARISYPEERLSLRALHYRLEVKGLQGGHSGMEIHKGLGNANKILNRILYHLAPFGLRVSSIDGGGLRNAIPREAIAMVAFENDREEEIMLDFNSAIAAVKSEFATADPGLQISLARIQDEGMLVMPLAIQEKLLRALYVAPNGVYRMSADFADLVETSNNIARVAVKQGEAIVKCLTRSSVESSKWDLATAIKSCFELIGAEVTFSGDYPGWTPNPNSAILEVLKDTYYGLFNEPSDVVACHAGLECGILGAHYPNLDMISFGPTIRGAHSPQERVSIASVQKFWKFLLEILQRIPNERAFQ